MELDMKMVSLHIIYALVQGLCLSLWMILPFVRCSNKFRQTLRLTLDPVNIPCQTTRMTWLHRRTCPWETGHKKKRTTRRNREKRVGEINKVQNIQTECIGSSCSTCSRSITVSCHSTHTIPREWLTELHLDSALLLIRALCPDALQMATHTHTHGPLFFTKAFFHTEAKTLVSLLG